MFLAAAGLGGLVGSLFGRKKKHIHHTTETRIIEKAIDDPFILQQKAMNAQVEQELQRLQQSGNQNSQRIEELEREKQRIEEDTLIRFAEIKSQYEAMDQKLEVIL